MSEKKEYIERGALIERLNSLITTSDLFGMGVQSGFSHAIAEAKNIPAADVEPVVHAQWIEIIGNMAVACRTHYCSECGQHGDDGMKRCPNCGAHMERSGSGE